MRFVALALLLAAAFVPRLFAQDAPAASCEIAGHLSIADVHVVRAPGVLSLVAIDERDVRVTPLGGGQFRVRTADEGTAIEGRTESALPLVLALDHTFGGVATVPAGTRVEGVTPRGARLRVDVPVHEGVTLANVELGCPDLAARTSTDAALDVVDVSHGPSWHARVPSVRVRSTPGEGAAIVAVRLAPDARTTVTWTERERRAGWVRTELRLAHAHVLGWVRDTDLAPP